MCVRACLLSLFRRRSSVTPFAALPPTWPPFENEHTTGPPARSTPSPRSCALTCDRPFSIRNVEPHTHSRRHGLTTLSGSHTRKQVATLAESTALTLAPQPLRPECAVALTNRVEPRSLCASAISMDRLRAELKEWENGFKRDHSRAPTRQDIKDDPAIGELLRQTGRPSHHHHQLTTESCEKRQSTSSTTRARARRRKSSRRPSRPSHRRRSSPSRRTRSFLLSRTLRLPRPRSSSPTARSSSRSSFKTSRLPARLHVNNS